METKIYRRDRRVKKDNDKGSLTVEALLFLIPFIMAFCTLINAARFVQAEMLIHHAVTQTAKQLSTYSYVLTKAKISERIVNTNRKSEELKVTVNEAASSVEGFIDAVSDMDGLVEGVFSAVKGGIEQKAITSLVGEMTKNNIKNELMLVSDDPDEYLKNIGIEGGLSGLHFDKTECLNDTEGKGSIKIIASYTMKNILFPDFDFGTYEFCQCAYTLIW
jgi:hypothetical protein